METATLATNAPPAVGQEWNGGKYIGITVDNGQPARLVVLPEEFSGNWKAAGAWAEQQGGTMPSRIDQLVMLPHRDLLGMKKAWYWSSESYAGNTAYAWCQHFITGYQDYNHKINHSRARAVRRYPLSDSVL